MSFLDSLGFAVLLAAFALMVWCVRTPDPDDCRRACSPACVAEWVDSTDTTSGSCRCGPCPGEERP